MPSTWRFGTARSSMPGAATVNARPCTSKTARRAADVEPRTSGRRCQYCVGAGGAAYLLLSLLLPVVVGSGRAALLLELPWASPSNVKLETGSPLRPEMPSAALHSLKPEAWCVNLGSENQAKNIGCEVARIRAQTKHAKSLTKPCTKYARSRGATLAAYCLGNGRHQRVCNVAKPRAKRDAGKKRGLSRSRPISTREKWAPTLRCTILCYFPDSLTCGAVRHAPKCAAGPSAADRRKARIQRRAVVVVRLSAAGRQRQP